MFGRTREKKNTNAAAKVITEFLYPQITLQANKEGIEEKLLDVWAMGYILGVLDAALQEFQIVHESDWGIAVGVSTFRMMFPNVQPDGGAYYWTAIDMQDNREFQKGVICGGTEIVKAINGETTGIMGLGYFLYSGKKREYE